MPKTFDEKREAFDAMLEGRLPKAVKAIELLANLARKSDYAWTPGCRSCSTSSTTPSTWSPLGVCRWFVEADDATVANFPVAA